MIFCRRKRNTQPDVTCVPSDVLVKALRERGYATVPLSHLPPLVRELSRAQEQEQHVAQLFSVLVEALRQWALAISEADCLASIVNAQVVTDLEDLISYE